MTTNGIVATALPIAPAPSPIPPTAGTAINAAGAAHHDAHTSPLDALVREKRLLPGQVSYGKLFVDGKEYLLALSLPLTPMQAVAARVRQRRAATGYVSLATTPVDEPTLAMHGGEMTAKFAVSALDPTPEGALARKNASDKRDQDVRAREIRRMMTNLGLTHAEAAGEFDLRNPLTPGLTLRATPVLTHAPAPVAGELADLAIPPADPTADRVAFVAQVRKDVIAGRIDVAAGSQRIREFDANTLV